MVAPKGEDDHAARRTGHLFNRIIAPRFRGVYSASSRMIDFITGLDSHLIV